MRYHNIVHDDMLNGDGLRVTVFVAGCSHYCKGCQNPITWDQNGGIEFDEDARKEVYEQLSKDYISGITFSGGDPLHEANIKDVKQLIRDIRKDFIGKTVWLYTGSEYEDIDQEVKDLCDVLVVGEFVEELKDANYHWAGSTNQRVIKEQTK